MKSSESTTQWTPTRCGKFNLPQRFFPWVLFLVITFLSNKSLCDVNNIDFQLLFVCRAVLATFTSEQMSRYECYRRSGFQRANMRRVSFFHRVGWVPANM